MILLFGNVGSGKGTQADLLAKKFQRTILSSGEILRQQSDPYIKDCIARGQLVKDDVLLPIMEAKINQLAAKHEQPILDGFPRTVDQAKWLIKRVQSGEFSVWAIIHLVISKEAAMERLLNRERSDDYSAAIKQRFTAYDEKVLPTLEYLHDAGYTVSEIDALQTPEQVHQSIMKVLNESQEPS